MTGLLNGFLFGDGVADFLAFSICSASESGVGFRGDGVVLALGGVTKSIKCFGGLSDFNLFVGDMFDCC